MENLTSPPHYRPHQHQRQPTSTKTTHPHPHPHPNLTLPLPSPPPTLAYLLCVFPWHPRTAYEGLVTATCARLVFFLLNVDPRAERRSGWLTDWTCGLQILTISSKVWTHLHWFWYDGFSEKYIYIYNVGSSEIMTLFIPKFYYKLRRINCSWIAWILVLIPEASEGMKKGTENLMVNFYSRFRRINWSCKSWILLVIPGASRGMKERHWKPIGELLLQIKAHKLVMYSLNLTRYNWSKYGNEGKTLET